MPTKEELLQAIEEVKERPASYSNCKMLSTFYTLLNYLYPASGISETGLFDSGVVGDYGDSEFLQRIKGQPVRDVILTINELMDALKALNPKLYINTMSRL